MNHLVSIAINLSKTFLKLLFVTVCALTLTSCENSGSCISPGDGYSMMNKTIKISGSQVSWIDTGFTVDAEKTLEMSIAGTINYCADASNKSVFDVPAVKCNAGSEPGFGNDAWHKASWTQITNDKGATGLCANLGGISDDIPKIATGITVSTGDFLSISVVPEERELSNCARAFELGFALDSGDFDLAGGGKISAVDLCKYGGTINLEGAVIKIDKMEGRTFQRYISNHPGSIGNKVAWKIFGMVGDGGEEKFVLNSNIGNPWLLGSFVDLRIKEKPELNSSICSYGITAGGDGRPNTSEYSKFETEKLNSYCNFLNNKDPNEIRIFSSNNESDSNYQYWSALVKSSTTENIEIDIGGGMKENIVVEYPDTDYDMFVHEIIPNLKVQLGDSVLDYDYKSEKFDKQLTNSARNMKPIEIMEENLENKEVILSINDIGTVAQNRIGGMRIEVEKQCARHDGDTLYMYIADHLPTDVVPGDSGTFHIGHRGKDGHNNIYTVNKDNEPKSGKIYLAIKQPPSSQTTTSGEYNVIIAMHIFRPLISKPFAWLENIILTLLRGEAAEDGTRNGGVMRSIYEGIVNSTFRAAVFQTITIYIAFVAFGFLFGLIKTSGNEVLTRVIKIGIIATLISDYSWEFFYNNLFEFYLDSARYLINVFGGRYETDTSFAFLDPTLGIILTSETWIRFLSLLFSGVIGWLYASLMILAFMEFIFAAGFGIMLYLMSLIAVSFLISIAPIFIVFSLFAFTRNLFDVWVKQISTFVAQPIFLFASIGLLNQVARMTIYNALNFGACKECVIPIYIGPPIPEFCLLAFFTPMGFADLPYEERVSIDSSGNSGNFFGMPIQIQYAVHLFISMYCMKIVTKLSLYMPEGIFGSTFGSLTGAARSASEGAKALVGMDEESIQRRKSSSMHYKKPEDIQLSGDSGAVGRGGVGENNNPDSPDADILSGGRNENARHGQGGEEDTLRSPPRGRAALNAPETNPIGAGPANGEGNNRQGQDQVDTGAVAGGNNTGGETQVVQGGNQESDQIRGGDYDPFDIRPPHPHVDNNEEEVPDNRPGILHPEEFGRDEQLDDQNPGLADNNDNATDATSSNPSREGDN